MTTYTIGVDPSSKRLAIFVLRDGVAIHSEWRPLPADKNEMCLKAMMYVQMICKKWGIRSQSSESELDFIIEEPIVGRGGAYATIIQAKVQGACIAGAMSSGWVRNIYTVLPATWKKEVIGSGNFPKDQIGNWLSSNWPKAHQLCNTPDQWDAACISQYGYGLSTGRYSKPDTAKNRRRKRAVKK